MSTNNFYPITRATTVVAIHHNNEIVIRADEQATIGSTMAKSNVNKYLGEFAYRYNTKNLTQKDKVNTSLVTMPK